MTNCRKTVNHRHPKVDHIFPFTHLQKLHKNELVLPFVRALEADSFIPFHCIWYHSNALLRPAQICTVIYLAGES